MPNGSNKLLSGVYRISDYLDKQAIREKEKKKEKFLQVLPTYLEQQISGIEDEKTLLSTIPKLSAQMYQYGADVGSAANQILGNLAQTKYKELAVTSADQQRQAGIDVVKDVYGQFPGLEGGKVNEITSALEGKYGKNVTPDMLKTIFESNIHQKKGVMTRDNSGTYYTLGSLNPRTGKWTDQTVYKIEKDEFGRSYFDDPTTEKNENLPLTYDAMVSLADQQEKEQQLKDQLSSKLTYQGLAYDLTLRKQDEATRRKIMATPWKHIETGAPIYPTINKAGNVSFYEKGRETFNLLRSTGEESKGGQEVDVMIPVKDLRKVDKVGEFGGIKSDDLTTTDKRYIAGRNHTYLTTVAGILETKGYAVASELKDLKSIQGYFSIDIILEKVEDHPDDLDLQGVREELLRLQLEAKDVLTGGAGVTPGQTQINTLTNPLQIP